MDDRLLVRPTALELTAALAESGDGERSFWEAHLAPLREPREGRRYWPEQRVGLAWWTDHHGRRHFRVVASNENPFGTTKVPVLADLYPDACVCRGLGRRRPGWVLLCGCGAVVPADAPAGWMGPCCLDCHRAEPTTRPATARILDLGPGVAAASGGSRIVVVEEGEQTDQVRVFDPDGRQLWTLEGLRVHTPITLSPDGRHLFLLGGTRLQVVEVDTGRFLLDAPQVNDFRVQFSPDGSAVAFLTQRGVRTFTFDRTTGGLRRRMSYRGNWSIAWSPRGERVALASFSKQAVLLNGHRLPFNDPPLPLLEGPPGYTWSARPTEQEFIVLRERQRWVRAATDTGTPRVWFTAGGAEVCCLHARPGEGERPQPEVRLTRWRWGRRRWTRIACSPMPALKSLALSADGRWLAADSGYVEVYDVLTGRKRGAVGWPDPEGNRPRPQFTEDGRGMLMSHRCRMRVVPWALLLGAGG